MIPIRFSNRPDRQSTKKVGDLKITLPLHQGLVSLLYQDLSKGLSNRSGTSVDTYEGKKHLEYSLIRFYGGSYSACGTTLLQVNYSFNPAKIEIFSPELSFAQVKKTVTFLFKDQFEYSPPKI